MGESEAISGSDGPATVASLVADLRALGLAPGAVVIAHASLSALGWVVGGAQAVVEALLEAIGPHGTLVMPTHTTHNSDPEHWIDPPVPRAWHEAIRAHMPAFDRDRTPSRRMGAVAELFRTWTGVLRSGHPQVSFAAWGLHAEQVTRDHALDAGLGERSPLARVYPLDGLVLLLGVGHDRNTSIHLAEHRATWPGRRFVVNGAAVSANGVRSWVTFSDLDARSDDFLEIGAAFAETGVVRAGSVAAAGALLMPQRALVDFATVWMGAHRGPEAEAATVVL